MGVFPSYYNIKIYQCTWHTGFNVKNKYNIPNVLFMRFNTCIFPFLSASCPSAHLSISGKKPLKSTPTKTINNNIDKALSCGTTHLCFHKCDKSNGAALFPAYKSNQSFGLVHSRAGCSWKSLLPLLNWSWLKIDYFVLFTPLWSQNLWKKNAASFMCLWNPSCWWLILLQWTE